MQEIRLKVRVKWFVSSGFAGWFHSLDNSTFREICIRTPHQWCAYAVDRHQLHIYISEHHMGHQTIMKSIMCWLLIAWHRPQPTNSITILLQHRIPFPFHFCTLRCDECVRARWMCEFVRVWCETSFRSVLLAPALILTIFRHPNESQSRSERENKDNFLFTVEPPINLLILDFSLDRFS